MKLTIAEIAEACRGTLVGKGPGPLPTLQENRLPGTPCRKVGSGPVPFPTSPSPAGPGSFPTFIVATGLAWDSRLVKPGDLYVALPGERVDGHDFACAAVAAGAVAVLATRPVDVEAPVIVVGDALVAVADLAACWRGRLKGTVIGLTGSTGKTTTKNLVRDVLSAAGTVVATKANQNNELGVPATLLAANEDTDFVVVEMGMRGLGQIEALCKMARPDWGLVTNVGESHIELLGSRENIARAKAELLAALPEGGIAFVNAADELVADLLEFSQVEEHGVTVAFFDGSKDWSHVDIDALGIFQNGDPFVWPDFVELNEEGRPSFNLCKHGFPAADRLNMPVPVKLALRGMHNVSNACSAAAVGLAAGLTLSQCAEALAAAQPEAGRQQVLRTPAGVTVVDDSYNANPDSMGASLATFAAMDVKGRRIAVLGDMLELGDFAKAGHERMGALAAGLGIDRLVCVGALSRDMARAARESGMSADAVSECADAAAALAIVIPELRPGDAVLAKASHSIGLESVVKGLVG